MGLGLFCCQNLIIESVYLVPSRPSYGRLPLTLCWVPAWDKRGAFIPGGSEYYVEHITESTPWPQLHKVQEAPAPFDCGAIVVNPIHDILEKKDSS